MRTAISLLACVVSLSACATPKVTAEGKALYTFAGEPCPDDAAAPRVNCRTKSEWRLASLAEDERFRAQERRDINALNTAAAPQYTPKFAKGLPGGPSGN